MSAQEAFWFPAALDSFATDGANAKCFGEPIVGVVRCNRIVERFVVSKRENLASAWGVVQKRLGSLNLHPGNHNRRSDTSGHDRYKSCKFESRYESRGNCSRRVLSIVVFIDENADQTNLRTRQACRPADAKIPLPVRRKIDCWTDVEDRM